MSRTPPRDGEPSDGLWPSESIPKKMEAARVKLAAHLEHEVGNR